MTVLLSRGGRYIPYIQWRRPWKIFILGRTLYFSINLTKYAMMSASLHVDMRIAKLARGKWCHQSSFTSANAATKSVTPSGRELWSRRMFTKGKCTVQNVCIVTFSWLKEKTSDKNLFRPILGAIIQSRVCLRPGPRPISRFGKNSSIQLWKLSQLSSIAWLWTRPTPADHHKIMSGKI